MSIKMNNDENIPTEPEAFYEKVAAQEEIYLEATVEEVRVILTSDDQSSTQTTAEFWQSKIEVLELDGDVD